MTTTKKKQRLRAVLTGIAILLVGLSAEGLHELFSPHRICVVHGTVEHGHHGEPEDHPHTATEQQGDHQGSRLALDSDQGVHESCWLVTFGHEEVDLALPPRTPVGALLARARILHARPNDAPRPPSIATLRLAPKQSPPLA